MPSDAEHRFDQRYQAFRVDLTRGEAALDVRMTIATATVIAPDAAFLDMDTTNHPAKLANPLEHDCASVAPAPGPLHRQHRQRRPPLLRAMLRASPRYSSLH